MRIVEMVRNDIKKSSLLRTKILIYAFNGRTFFKALKPTKLTLFLVLQKHFGQKHEHQ